MVQPSQPAKPKKQKKAKCTPLVLGGTQASAEGHADQDASQASQSMVLTQAGSQSQRAAGSATAQKAAKRAHGKKSFKAPRSVAAKEATRTAKVKKAVKSVRDPEPDDVPDKLRPGQHDGPEIDLLDPETAARRRSPPPASGRESRHLLWGSDGGDSDVDVESDVESNCSGVLCTVCGTRREPLFTEDDDGPEERWAHCERCDGWQHIACTRQINVAYDDLEDYCDDCDVRYRQGKKEKEVTTKTATADSGL